MVLPLAAKLENTIRQHRLFEFPVDWSQELIFPYYDGLSLRNVPHSIAQAFGAPLRDSSPLQNEVWQAQTPEAKRVVVFLMDGLGYKHLKMFMDEDSELYDAVLELNGGREVVPLTSVAPSTTVVALSTLWTGAPPAQTAMTGTLMFLREVSLLANMLTFAPIAGRHTQDVLANWGLTPEQIVKSKGLSQHLLENDIATYTVTNQIYVGTGLSRILHRGSENILTHKALSDFMPLVKNVLEDTKGKHCYVGIYWEAVDALAHKYGAHTEYTKREIREKILALRDLISNSDVLDGQTLFLFLADHGHYDALQQIRLGDDPILLSAMQMSISGDERHGYMYVRQGMMDAVKNRILSRYSDQLTCIETQIAIDSGYFGDHPGSELVHRAGDLILLPRQGYILNDPVLGSLPMISRHAGLSDWEMLVPFIWKLS